MNQNLNLYFVILLLVACSLIKNTNNNLIKNNKIQSNSKKLKLHSILGSNQLLPLHKKSVNQLAKEQYEKLKNQREDIMKNRNVLKDQCKNDLYEDTKACKDFFKHEKKEKERKEDYEEDGENEFSVYEKLYEKTMKNYTNYDSIYTEESKKVPPIKEKKKAPEQSSKLGNCNTNSITGMKGICTGEITKNTNLSKALDYLSVESYKKWINHVIESLLRSKGLPQICFGDFDPDYFASTPTLQYSACADIPLPGGNVFGLVAFSSPEIKCSDGGKIEFCVAYDNCGTFSLVVSGGLLKCVPGSQPIWPILDFVADIGMSFSYYRRLSLTFEIPLLNKSDELEIYEYDFIGHISMTSGIIVPFEKINIMSKKLDDYLEIENRVGYMIDLGASTYNTVKNSVDLITGSSKKSTLKDNIIDTLKLSIRYGFQLSTLFKIKLDEITKGFLPDLEIEVSKATIAIFNQDTKLSDNPNSLLINTGIYINLGKNLDYGINTIVGYIFENLEYVIGSLGIDIPGIPEVGIEMSLIINTKYVVINISAKDFAGLTCYFKFSSDDASCNIGFDFFSLIAEGAKWLLKKATKFFENIGDTIIKFKKGAGKFAQNSAKAAYKYLREKALDSIAIINNASKELKALGDKADDKIKESYKRAISISKGTLEKNNKLFKSIKDKGERTLYLSGKALWNWIDKEAKLEYLEDVGKDVKNYYKEKLKLAEDKLEEIEKISKDTIGISSKAAKKSAEIAKRNAQRMKDKLEDVKDTIEDVMDDIEDELEDLFEDIYDSLKFW